MNLEEVGFSDYRRTNDGVMVADVGFKKQLWALDPELDIVWDWGSNKWEIWKFPGQGKKKKKRINHLAQHITSVQTRDRSFREVGADIILKLQAGDTTKYSLNQLCSYFDEMDNNLQRAKRKKFEAAIGAATEEAWWYRAGLRLQIPRRFMEGTKFLFEGPSKEKKTEMLLGGGA